MSQIQVIKLEPVEPAVSERGSEDWLANMFAPKHQCTIAIDLTANKTRWPQKNDWPEFDEVRRAKEWAIAHFPGKTFSNFEEVDAALTEVGYGPKKRSYLPDLADQIVPRMDQIWELRQREGGSIWIHTSSHKSLWRGDDGRLCLPCLNLRPASRRVDACWGGFSDSSGFLVSCE